MSVLDWLGTPPTLTDGRIALRAFEADDAAAVLAACQDSDIQRWTTVAVPYRLSRPPAS